jgi:phage protein D
MAKPDPTQPLVVAAFGVVINGSPLAGPAAAHVVSVTIDEDLGLPGMFAVELVGSEDQGQEIPWIDDTNLFSVGNVVELKLGYGDQTETLMVGEITGLEPEFGASRLPNLLVRGFDRLHRLQRGRKTRTFTQQKDSDLASQIANEAGLTPDVQDSGVTHEYIVQANQTDLEFLRSRATRINYEVAVDDKTLLFKPARNAESALFTLKPDDGLLEFHPRLTSLGQANEVSVRGWSVKDKDKVVGQSRTGDEVSTMGGQETGPANAESAFGSAVQTLSAWPVTSQAEADQIAKARLNDLALSYITGEGSCWGRTDVRGGVVIDIQGVGKRFSGSYYVTGVSHRYTSRRGYLTHFAVRRNAS